MPHLVQVRPDVVRHLQQLQRCAQASAALGPEGVVLDVLPLDGVPECHVIHVPLGNQAPARQQASKEGQQVVHEGGGIKLGANLEGGNREEGVENIRHVRGYAEWKHCKGVTSARKGGGDEPLLPTHASTETEVITVRDGQVQEAF